MTTTATNPAIDETRNRFFIRRCWGSIHTLWSIGGGCSPFCRRCDNDEADGTVVIAVILVVHFLMTAACLSRGLVVICVCTVCKVTVPLCTVGIITT